MIIVSIDFSEHNEICEQLSFKYLYELPFFNEFLLDCHIRNFIGMEISSFFVVYKEELNLCTDKAFFIKCICENNLKMHINELEDDERLFIIRNDLYFEAESFSPLVEASSEDAVIKFENGLILGVLLTVESLKKQLHFINSLKDFFNSESVNRKKHIYLKGYCSFLENLRIYKNTLTDILKYEYLHKPPLIAEGIYTEGKIPKGDYVITPPVYIDTDVQIENGAVIGPFTIILGDTLVSKDSIVSNTVLFEDVYISSNCFIDDSVCCRGVAIKRNAAVLPHCIMGVASVVCENSVLPMYSELSKNAVFGNSIKTPLINSFNYPKGFQGLTPEKAALLGSAIGYVFKKPEICIGSDGSENANAIKLALLGGLVYSGARCTDIGSSYYSRIFYSGRYLNSDYSIFVVGAGGGTDIKINNSSGYSITSTDFFNLQAVVKGNTDFKCSKEDCRKISQLKGLSRVYVRDIAELFEDELHIKTVVFTKNMFIEKTINEILKKIGEGPKHSSEMIFKINNDGTNLTCLFNGEHYSFLDLKRFVGYYGESREEFFEYTAEFKGLWRRDAVLLLFNVLAILNKSSKAFDELINALPDFFVISKNINSHIKSVELIKKLMNLPNTHFYKNYVDIKLEKGRVAIGNLADNKNLILKSFSYSEQAAKEMIRFLIDFIENQ